VRENLFQRLDRLQGELAGIDRQAAGYAAAAGPSDPLVGWLREEHDLLESLAPLVGQELMLRGGDVRLVGVEELAWRIVSRAREAGLREPFESIVTAAELESVAPSELSSFLNFLQLGLLERLADVVQQLFDDPTAVKVEAALPELHALARRIRELVAAKWDDRYWSCHALDAVLRGDPLGVYETCDDDTRAALFTAVGELARWSGRDELSVAATAIALGNAATDDAARHAGYFLVDEGRESLEAELRCRAPLRRRLFRFARRHPATAYLLPTAFLTTLQAAVCALVLIRAGAGTIPTTVLVLALLLPLLAMSVDLVNWVAWVLLHPPQKLPRIRFRNAIPDELRSLVVIPAMLHSVDDVDTILEMTEANYLSNRDPNIRFAILTDFPDGAQQQMAGDAPLLEAMTRGLQRLNERYGTSLDVVFSLLHRERQWNERQRAWMAWERKRGKIVELNELIVSGTTGGLQLRIGDLAAIRSVRYIISLDADTRLPMGVAARLIGTIAHPLNAARARADGSLARGFTVIQPRIRTVNGAASATPFASWFRSKQFTSALDYLQDVHQSLVGTSLYCGKGIYDVPAFHASLVERVPENALLSHDHFEGMHGRVGVALDVVISEDYPTNVLSFMRRLHRWTRGDWQVLPWLLPIVPSPGGRFVRTRFAPIDRWRIFENLRSSLLPVATLASLVLGWLLIPRHALAWTIALSAIYAHQAFVMPLAGPVRAAKGSISWHGLAGETMHRFAQQAGRLIFPLTFLGYQAVTVIDAVSRTLYRLFVSRRNLLEWTAAAQSARSIRMTSSFMWRELRAGVLLTAAIAVVLAIQAPQSLPVAAPFLLLWLFAPQFAYWTGLGHGAKVEDVPRDGGLIQT